MKNNITNSGAGANTKTFLECIGVIKLEVLDIIRRANELTVPALTYTNFGIKQTYSALLHTFVPPLSGTRTICLYRWIVGRWFTRPALTFSTIERFSAMTRCAS
jgi:hypothetical protein